MNESTLRNNIIDEHRLKYYNNCKLVSYDDKLNSNLEYYYLDELSNIDKDWFPLCCYQDINNKLIYGGKSKIVHTYIEGETGCGKTTRIAIQSINALSHMKNKPSFIVVDPFGEICENTYYNFKKLNYNIKIFNCDNPFLSHTYNPFLILADEVIEKKCITSNVEQKLKRLSQIIIQISSKTDPIWEIGASSYLNGLMLDLFEDLLLNKIKKENINFYTIIQRHYWLRRKITEVGGRNIFEIENYDQKGINSLAVQKLISITNNSEKTRDCYFGVLENYLDSFGQTSVYQLSSNSSININDLIDKPTVIFVQSGGTSIGEDLATILIDDLYTFAEQNGRKSLNKRLPRNIHIFFDEFANYNFGKGEDYIRMLTTSRKFGLYWHMYLQCDAQLDKKFNSCEIGNIIRANCTEIFMGSQDYKTIKRFSTSCGEQTIESLNSKLYNNISLEKVPLVSESKLMEMGEGYMYIKINNAPILFSYFESYYNCQEFKKLNNIYEVYPINDYKYQETLVLPDEDSIDEAVIYRRINAFLKENLMFVNTNSGNKIVGVDISQSQLDELIEEGYLYDFMQISEDKLELAKNPTENETPNNNYSFVDFINQSNKKEYIDILSTISCIPTEFTNVIKDSRINDIKLESESFQYDIIKKFVIENNIDDKNTLNEKFKQELNKIESCNEFLSEYIISCFENAYFTFLELDLDNIIEIRKIK